MPKISNLELTNYKSFRHLEFELKPLNILIGRNGTGKSNLISFFRLLCNAAEGRLADTIRGDGGLNELRWRGSGRNDYIEWELTFENLKTIDSQCYYIGSLAPQGNSFSVQREKVERPPYPTHRERYKFLSVSDGQVQILQAKPGTEYVEDGDNNYAYSAQELVIAQLRDPIRYPTLNEIRQLLADWTIFRGFGENALKNIYDSQSLDVVSPPRLDSEGKNLVSVLYAIANDPRYANAQEQLMEILADAFHDFRQLNFPLVASGKAELQWRSTNGWQFPASQVSDGMLRFLGLATLLLLPDPPSLIAIDEPEIGLHPELIPLLASLLKSASTRTQIIVTTHSPQLLNSQEIQPEDIVVVERTDGETLLERLDPEQLRLWLERYTLGSLWTMGKLEHS